MVHTPSSIDAVLPPYAIALAERARRGALVVYAGAGLSFSEPTAIPNGKRLAQGVHALLLPVFSELAGVQDDDLLVVAESVASLPGGEDALRQAIVTVAEFTSAAPSYGHKILALLLLEGVVDVLTTNWDNCIERGYQNERIEAVVNDHDLSSMLPPTVLKIHGCATQPSSLLVTKGHLDAPPSWVIDQTRARLGSKTVVFLGIGDVAGYVKVRLTEAIGDVGLLKNVRVVSPNIVSKWGASQWASVAPALAHENRIAAGSDEFLERLASAYVYLCLSEFQAAITHNPSLATAFASSTRALSTNDAANFIVWLRKSGVVARAGTPVVGSTAASNLLLALGLLSGDTLSLLSDGTVSTSSGPYETLIGVGATPSTRMSREAKNRAEARLNTGAALVPFLVSGGLGWSPTDGVLPVDIVRDGDVDDVLDGPRNATPQLLRAEELIEA